MWVSLYKFWWHRWKIYVWFWVFNIMIYWFLSNDWTIIAAKSIMSTSPNMFSISVCSGWTPSFIWILGILRASFIFFSLINKRKLAFFTIFCHTGLTFLWADSFPSGDTSKFTSFSNKFPSTTRVISAIPDLIGDCSCRGFCSNNWSSSHWSELFNTNTGYIIYIRTVTHCTFSSNLFTGK